MFFLPARELQILVHAIPAFTSRRVSATATGRDPLRLSLSEPCFERLCCAIYATAVHQFRTDYHESYILVKEYFGIFMQALHSC